MVEADIGLAHADGAAHASLLGEIVEAALQAGLDGKGRVGVGFGPGDDVAQGDHLDGEAGLGQLRDGSLVEDGDTQAAAAFALQDALGEEGAHGLANGDAADGELLGDIDFQDTLAAFQMPGADGVDDGVGHLLGQAFRALEGQIGCQHDDGGLLLPREGLSCHGAGRGAMRELAAWRRGQPAPPTRR